MSGMEPRAREQEFNEMMDSAIAILRERRETTELFRELAQEDPESAARVVTTSAVEERARIRRELMSRFGTELCREEKAFRYRLVVPDREPKRSQEAVALVDLMATLTGWEMAWEAMSAAAAFFPASDRAQKVCDAFVDVFEQLPAAYNFFALEGSNEFVKEYATAVVTAWVRSNLKTHGGNLAALKDKNWQKRLASAAFRAWEELGSDSPMKRSTRYRDTLPKTADGRRRKAKGPQTYINLTDAILSNRGRKAADTPELELARFAEREAALRRGREVGLPPREMEVFKFFVENLGAKNREAADHFGISVGAIKKIKNRIKNTLGAA